VHRDFLFIVLMSAQAGIFLLSLNELLFENAYSESTGF